MAGARQTLLASRRWFVFAVVAMDAPHIYFYQGFISQIAHDPPATALVVDCEQMADMDATGAEEITALYEELHDAGVELWLTRLHGAARVTAEKAGVIDAIGEERVLATVREAGQALRARGFDRGGDAASGTDDET